MPSGRSRRPCKRPTSFLVIRTAPSPAMRSGRPYGRQRRGERIQVPIGAMYASSPRSSIANSTNIPADSFVSRPPIPSAPISWRTPNPLSQWQLTYDVVARGMQSSRKTTVARPDRRGLLMDVRNPMERSWSDESAIGRLRTWHLFSREKSRTWFQLNRWAALPPFPSCEVTDWRRGYRAVLYPDLFMSWSYWSV